MRISVSDYKIRKNRKNGYFYVTFAHPKTGIKTKWQESFIDRETALKHVRFSVFEQNRNEGLTHD